MKPVGYSELVARYQLDVLPLSVSSFLADRGKRQTAILDGQREEHFPPRDDPGEAWTDHLLFALKREGINLEVLAALFRRVTQDSLVEWIRSAPGSRYTRVAWFLYEWLLGQRLPLPDLTQGNYIPVLDERYYGLPWKGTELHDRRQRVVNNLFGTPAYCPLVLRSDAMRRFEEMRLDQIAIERAERFTKDVLYRAVQYLYVKETKSSFAIEHLAPGQRRIAGFVALLRQAEKLDCYSEDALVRLQKAIVEERYAAEGFRDFQNYVGESVSPSREIVHYIPPRPEELPELMQGWITCCRRMRTAGVHPVVLAAVAGFGFVFLHPFNDGNGRIHRFLIHNALAEAGFAPPGLIFPVSATMLKQIKRYDEALESFSRLAIQRVDYELDSQGQLLVGNNTASFYRFQNMTPQAESLFGFILDTINTEFTPELEYLAAFDAARKQMRDVVDMPNDRMDLFLRLCLQGKGHLSKSKRPQFAELSDEECARLESIVQAAMNRTESFPAE